MWLKPNMLKSQTLCHNTAEYGVTTFSSPQEQMLHLNAGLLKGLERFKISIIQTLMLSCLFNNRDAFLIWIESIFHFLQLQSFIELQHNSHTGSPLTPAENVTTEGCLKEGIASQFYNLLFHARVHNLSWMHGTKIWKLKSLQRIGNQLVVELILGWWTIASDQHTKRSKWI